MRPVSVVPTDAARVALASSTPFAADAILFASFGGPEAPEQVMPFLRHVTQGRGVSDERLAEVAKHYQHFGGISPINGQNRDLIERLQECLAATPFLRPIHFGNRHAAPFLADAMQTLARDHKQVLVILTSAFSSYSGCRQYREAISQAAAEHPHLQFRKLPVFFDHPLFIEAWTAQIVDACATQAFDRIVFTAHSIPESMAAGCGYQQQLRVAANLIADALPAQKIVLPFDIAYQSRSGPPAVPWLGPDINDFLRDRPTPGERILCVPLGFLTGHMEVVWDLDHEAAETAKGLGITWLRSKMVAAHPLFVDMLVELIGDAIEGRTTRCMSSQGRETQPCSAHCCPTPAVRPLRGD